VPKEIICRLCHDRLILRTRGRMRSYQSLNRSSNAHLAWGHKAYCKEPATGPYWQNIYPVHNLTSKLFTIHFNNIRPLHLYLQPSHLCLDFLTEYSMHLPYIPRMLYAPPVMSSFSFSSKCVLSCIFSSPVLRSIASSFVRPPTLLSRFWNTVRPPSSLPPSNAFKH
jgi:hypothetical protein